MKLALNTLGNVAIGLAWVSLINFIWNIKLMISYFFKSCYIFRYLKQYAKIEIDFESRF